MKLYKIDEANELRHLYFGEYYPSKLLCRGLIVTLDSDNGLIKVSFNSTRFGTFDWSTSSGLISCSSWEDENQAQKFGSSAEFVG